MKLFKQLAAVTSFAACVGIAAPSISHASEPNHTLYPGTKNKNVAELQDTLKEKGYFKNSDVTGYYGTITENAVKAFQKDHHISVDGIAGPNTYKALNVNVKEAANDLGKELLAKGSRGQYVSLLQEKLQRLGFYKGHVDGIFGTLTETAVKAFQSAHNLAADGIVGPNTKAALLNGQAPVQPKTSTAAPVNNVHKETAQPKQAAQPQQPAQPKEVAQPKQAAQPVENVKKADDNVQAETAKPAQKVAPAKQENQNNNQNQAVKQNTQQQEQTTAQNTVNTQKETVKAETNKTQVKEQTNNNVQNHKQTVNANANQNNQNNNAADSSNDSGKTISVEATAYSLSGTTANGTQLNSNSKVIAVDPNVIPLGSKVYIPGYGTAVAADTGGAIKGNRIDVYIPNDQQAKNFGRKNVQIKVIK
ncbi:3D (Asp-Asp-Asp) domain-containing protein [Scopulibacillus daqui]|uniref:3D (Asp-Asp-Asp) domain-containing protein n=1 Tax=Scopulibacillus daqui TaxID=1469162 RepID=A0ABS2PUZ5_9BACL|nr:peptidoglycan-binding protein [Scopulibacillus daqui]MBM7643876.1 3D (Asp-Asp-Asp) domain-containing protein [Scopulibacillus daqui]